MTRNTGDRLFTITQALHSYFRDDDYQHFVCVETANTASDSIEIKPGREYRLGAEYQVVSNRGDYQAGETGVSESRCKNTV